MGNYHISVKGDIPPSLASRVSAAHADAILQRQGSLEIGNIESDREVHREFRTNSRTLSEPDREISGGRNRKGTPGCTSTPTQPGTQIPFALTQGSGSGTLHSTKCNASAATGGCCDAEA